ncbi:hypothetical protein A4D02_22860 [Niastella koreensis]|uniref:Uncharacterized protein n=1 Tax=Niastella koreensis TaxID=354356 RepID=A0ABX3P2J8_9BACT|nr:hypothetical protein A4D02_22860 [Niastella koreensis]
MCFEQKIITGCNFFLSNSRADFGNKCVDLVYNCVKWVSYRFWMAACYFFSVKKDIILPRKYTGSPKP